MMRTVAVTVGLAAAVSVADSHVVRMVVDSESLEEDGVETGGEKTCWIQDEMELTDTKDVAQKGGVFIRTVYNAASCAMCQVNNIADHPDEKTPLENKKRHAANEFTATRKKKQVGMVPATYELDDAGLYCFCNTENDRMPNMFFLGVDSKNPCTQEGCYEKYIYAAEKYVMQSEKVGQTALYLLPRVVPGVEAPEGAWTKHCCDASLDDCPISEANGVYTLETWTPTPSALGTFITPFGTLMHKFRGMGAIAEIGYTAWECPAAFCRVGDVAIPGTPVCYEYLNGEKQLANVADCSDGADEVCKPEESTPPCVLKVCQEGGECKEGEYFEAAMAAIK